MSTHTDRTTQAPRKTMTLEDVVMRLEGIAARARGAGENITLGRAKNGQGALATIANEARDLARHVREDLLYSHEAERIEGDLLAGMRGPDGVLGNDDPDRYLDAQAAAAEAWDDPGNDALRLPARTHSEAM